MNWDEYDSAAIWCAKRNIKGYIGDPLPVNLSVETLNEINEYPEAFQQRIKETAYALSMEVK